MAVIQTYDQRVLPQGQLDVRANGDDFGAGVGAAMQGVGNALGNVAESIFKYNEAQETTRVHVDMEKARAEWSTEFNKRVNSAKAGDDNFIPTLQNDMQAYFDKYAGNVQTPAAKRVFDTLSANMVSQFSQQAVVAQSHLAAQDAANQYKTLVTSIGNTARNNPAQFAAAVESGIALIDSQTSIFGRIQQPVRDEYKSNLESDAKMALNDGAIQRDAIGWLNQFSPDVAAKFNAFNNLVKSNAAPGAAPAISAGAMKWAPQVSAAASSRGVNPNVLLAQIDKESKGNPAAVNNNDIAVTGQASIGLAQFQPATAAQYGIDPKNPEQAIRGQAAYMGDLLKMFNGDYTKALAAYNWGPGNLSNAIARYGSDWQSHLPASTREYVDTIMNNAGMVGNPAGPQAPAPAPVQQGEPVQTGTIAGLSWQQQDHLVSKAIQVANMQLSMRERLTIEQEHLRERTQRDANTEYVRQIYNPKQYGEFNQLQMASDPRLDGAHITNLANVALAAARQPYESHPAVVQKLFTNIRAAENDPRKTYNMAEVDAALSSGQLNANEYEFLRNAAEGKTNPFQKKLNQNLQVVHDMFMSSIMGKNMPGAAADGWIKLARDVDKAVQAKRNNNEDPSSLIDPTSKDYMFTAAKLNGYLPNVALGMKDGATAIINTTPGLQNPAAPAAPAAPLPKLEVGKTYTINGKKLVYQGGPVDLSSSYKEAK